MKTLLNTILGSLWLIGSLSTAPAYATTQPLTLCDIGPCWPSPNPGTSINLNGQLCSGHFDPAIGDCVIWGPSEGYSNTNPSTLGQCETELNNCEATYAGRVAGQILVNFINSLN